MGNGFSEAPLAVFTTLAPMGAMSFIVLLLASLKGFYEGGDDKRLDKVTSVSLLVLFVGFVAAFFHLASPLNAVFVFAGIGLSPLTNEVFSGILVFLAGIVYCLLANMGKISNSGLRNGLLAAISILAIAFNVMCGMAYLMETIPSWNQVGTVLQMLGYGLMGGAALGAMQLGLAVPERASSMRTWILAIMVFGLVLGVGGFALQIWGCASVRNIWGFAIDLVPAIWGILATLAVGGIVGCVLSFVGAKAGKWPVQLISCIVVACVVFVARIGFYGLYMGMAV